MLQSTVTIQRLSCDDRARVLRALCHRLSLKVTVDLVRAIRSFRVLVTVVLWWPLVGVVCDHRHSVVWCILAHIPLVL
jgi:hypothetical protein